MFKSPIIRVLVSGALQRVLSDTSLKVSGVRVPFKALQYRSLNNSNKFLGFGFRLLEYVGVAAVQACRVGLQGHVAGLQACGAGQTLNDRQSGNPKP